VSRENVELVRRYYEDWNRGDTDAVIGAFAPDIEWHGHPRLPEPGPYVGRAEVKRWMGQFREAWGELSAHPVELIDAGDGVVALVHMSGRGRGSGVAVTGGVDVHVIAIDDRGVTSFRIYPGDVAANRAELTKPEREALILRVQDGLTVSEIAARLDASESAVDSTLDGAFVKLRDLPSKERS
jgi:ketosteroid isomerase-like protein